MAGYLRYTSRNESRAMSVTGSRQPVKTSGTNGDVEVAQSTGAESDVDVVLRGDRALSELPAGALCRSRVAVSGSGTDSLDHEGSGASHGIVPETQWVSRAAWSLLCRCRGGCANVA
jgi:hypothetical protein